MEINLKMSEKQLQLLKTDHFLNVCTAGRGSGKTAITSIIALLHLIEGRNVVIVAPTGRQAKRDNFMQLLRFMRQLKLPFYVNMSELRITWNNHHIYVLSGGLGESESGKDIAETFRGATSIATLIFDEAASLPEKVYTLAIATMRDLGGKARRVYIVGTPPSHEEHWVIQRARREDAMMITASAFDNPFIEQDFLEMLEKEYDLLPEHFKRRELYGELIFIDDGDMAVFNDFELHPGQMDYLNEPTVAGLDISGRGSDKTIMTIVKGRQVIDIIETITPTDEDVKKFAEQMWARFGFDVLRYDSTGFGHLLTFDLPAEVVVTGVNFGGAGGERFANARALIYARTAKLKTLHVSPETYKTHGKYLLGEVRATTWRDGDDKKLHLVKKDIIRQKVGRSPDRLDSLCLACSYIKAEAITAQAGHKVFTGKPLFRDNRL